MPNANLTCSYLQTALAAINGYDWWLMAGVDARQSLNETLGEQRLIYACWFVIGFTHGLAESGSSRLCMRDSLTSPKIAKDPALSLQGRA
jgi:hypothetical protein